MKLSLLSKTAAFLMLLVALISVTSCATPDLRVTNEGDRVYSGGKDVSEKNSIEGYVRDNKTKKPVKGAVIEIKNSSRGVGYYKTETDSSGYYKIKDFMPNIRYEISVSAPGYVTYSQTSQISSSQKDIPLIKESIISGKVTDSRGRALSGIEIKLKKYRGYYNSITSRPLFAKTDSSGRYSFNKLESGSYLLTYSSPEYITETARIKQVRKNETFRLSMVMYRPATVSGKVVIKKLDVPATDINITARGRYAYSNITYQDGSFRLEGLKPGRYKLYLTHQGFETITTDYININENSDKKLRTFHMDAKKPEVKIHSYRYTFTPGTSLNFNFRSLRMDSINVTVYKVPMEYMISRQKDPEEVSPKTAGFKKIMSWKEGVKQFKPYRWMYYSVNVNKALSPGGYCIEARGKGGSLARRLFTVTNIGVVMKRSPGNFYAYATDLVKNRPVKSAKIFIYKHSKYRYRKGKRYSQTINPQTIEDLPVKIIKKGTTDSDGIFRTSLNMNSRMSLLVLNKDGSYALCSAGTPGFYKSEKEKFYIYTERPVYRSGDQVNFKIVAKTRGKKFTPISNRTIYIKAAMGYSGSPLMEKSVELDEWGTATGSFTIPKDSKLGTYYIRTGFSANRLYGYQYFSVEQYRKPEFKVEILSGKKFYINGDTAEFKIDSKYFFGAPLKNAAVKYSFYEKKTGPLSGYTTRNTYSRIKLQGEKYTDNNGSVLLRIDSGILPYDREITLEATVTDKSNVSITSRKTVRIGRGEFYISMIPEKSFFDSTEKKKVTVKTIDHSGKPVSATVKLNLYRYIWKPVQMVYVHDSRPRFTRTVTTSSDGTATVSLPENFSSSGEFDLVATARDRMDNMITGSRVLWIYHSSGGSVASRFKNLEVSIDNKRLEDPGTVTCLVKSRYRDSYVWLTLEGRDIYESKVIKMDRNIVPVKFSVKGKYAPNLYVRAAMQRKRALYTTVDNVEIPVNDIKMKVTVTPSKKKYSPGETVNLKIKTTDEKGKALSSDLSLAAVDESIFSIKRDHTENIRDYFYSKISNWVLTTYSYPITLLAGASKSSPEKVRSNFKDTAFWKGNIKTGKDGMAIVTFKLPDNLTTWRLTLRGHDRAGRMGQVNSTILTTQDIVARIGKPRFMIERDTIDLIGIVNNNTNKGISSVNTEFTADNRVLRPKKEYKMSLPEYGSARKYYPYTVPSGQDSVKIKFKAETSGSSDALLHRVPVEKRGLEYSISGSGDNSSSRSITLNPIKDTSDFTFLPEEMEISVFPSIVLQMVKSLEYLNKYPYGCMEQTINRFMPAVALHELISKGNLSSLVDMDELNKFRKHIKRGIDKIENSQNYDGTWGWWSGDRGNASLTCYAMESLLRAKSAGFHVDKYKIDRGIKALTRMAGSSNLENSELSYVLYTYSIFKGHNHETYKRLSWDKKKTPYIAANLIRAGRKSLKNRYLTSSVKSEIKEIMARMENFLISQQSGDGRGVYWPASGKRNWSWSGGRTEVTATVLSTISGMPEYSGLASKAVLSLSKRFNGTSWKSTKETAAVIFAMTDYLKGKNYKYSPTGDLKFSLNGKEVATIKFDLRKNRNTESLTQKIKLIGLKSGNSYSVRMTGSGSDDIVYTAKIRGTLYFNPKGLFSFMKSEKRGIKSISNGISARRDIFYLSRIRDVKMQEYLVPSSLAERNRIRVGDEMLVKIRFRAKDNFKFLMLQDFLPSGFEVVKQDAYNGYKPYVHVEKRDNRMLYFFNGLKKGQEYEIAYIIRAELPGKFIMRPGKIECMYEPTIQGWSQPSIIEVNDK